MRYIIKQQFSVYGAWWEVIDTEPASGNHRPIVATFTDYYDGEAEKKALTLAKSYNDALPKSREPRFYVDDSCDVWDRETSDWVAGFATDYLKSPRAQLHAEQYAVFLNSIADSL